MDGVIMFLNVDLDLVSENDLSELGATFETAKVHPLHITKCNDGLWRATFEAWDEQHEPQPRIEAMLAVVESLPNHLRRVWDGCTLKEFNIGYDCGDEPWAFNQGLTAELLGRMASVGGALRLTLYPDKSDALVVEAEAE